jgi:hypothetical protein
MSVSAAKSKLESFGRDVETVSVGSDLSSQGCQNQVIGVVMAE